MASLHIVQYDAEQYDAEKNVALMMRTALVWPLRLKTREENAR
jgi:hypothetical protein